MKSIKIFKQIRKALPSKAIKRVKSSIPQLKWEGTPTDLMEIAYIVYLTKFLKNQKGREATIVEVTKVIFGTFGMDIPEKPTKIIDNIKRRKFPREVSKVWKALCQMYQDVFN